MTNALTTVDPEQAVLGACLQSPAVVDEVTAILRNGTDFHSPRHAILFDEIVALHRSGIIADPVTVYNAMAAKKLTASAPAPYLHELMQSVPSVGMAGHYAGLVRQAAVRRQLLEVGELHTAAARMPDVDQMIAAAVRARDLVDVILAGPGEDENPGTALGAVPLWPTKEIPGPIGELVRHSGGLPDALFGGVGLVAVATVIPAADVEVDPTMIESAILWVPLLAPPGAGKSPAMAIGMGPIEQRDAETHALYRDELQMWRETVPKDRGERPANRTRLVRDTTLEQLARRLDGARMPHGVSAATFAPDELQNFLGSLGQYKRGSADRARLLELWAGRPWQYERVGGDVDILIPRPVVPIVGGIQPELHAMLGGEGDGLRPRWLLHVAELDPVAQDAGGMATVPAGWGTLLDGLYSKMSTPRTWTLDEGPLRLWREARRRWKSAAAAGESASVSAALVKADVQAARVALVIAESLEPARGGALPPEAMEAAVAVVDFALDCWRALPEGQTLGLSRRSDALDLAVDKTRAWLEAHGGKAPRRDLQRANVAGCRTASDLDAILQRYVETYPGSVMQERTGARGRPAVVVSAPRRRPS